MYLEVVCSKAAAADKVGGRRFAREGGTGGVTPKP